MSKWKSFKRHPTSELGPYFAEIQDGVLDFDNEIIEEIVEGTGSITDTWPQLSLKDLRALTEQLRQKISIPSGAIVPLGTVTYLHQEAGKKRPTESGLTWMDAEISPNSSNFVIETVKNTINDEETRLDEDTSYGLLTNAFEELIAGAQELANFDAGDLPKLPSEDKYIDALEHNKQLTILPSKAVIGESIQSSPQTNVTKSETPTSDFPMPTQSHASDTPIPAPEPGVEESGASAGGGDPETASDSDGAKPILQAPASDESDEPKPTSNVQSTISKLMQGFNVEAPQFPLQGGFEGESFTAIDDGYVNAQLELEYKEANEFLKLSANQLTNTIRTKLVEVAAAVNVTKTASDFVSGDWQEKVKAKVTSKLQEEFSDRQSKELNALEANYQDDVQAENQRHERQLEELEKNYQASKDAKVKQNQIALHDSIVAEANNLIAEQQLYAETEVKQLNEDLIRKTEQQIAMQATAYLQHANGQMTEAFKQLKTQLEQKSVELQEVHEKAVQEAKDLAEKRQEMQKTEVEHAGILKLQQQNTALTQKNNSFAETQARLDQRIADLRAANEDLQLKYQNAQSEVESTARRLSDQSQQQLTTALVANLNGGPKSATSENQSSAPQKKHGFVRGMLTSAGIIGVFGAGVYGFHYVQASNAKADSAVATAKAAQASYEKKSRQIVLSSSESSTESSSKANTASDENTQTSKSTTSDKSFESLDQDIANNSLKVYYQSFYNKDLGTNSRVLLVGKRLIASGNISDAKLLAQANPNHSSDLWMAIGEAQAGN